MGNRPTVVCLCGSTRFAEFFNRVAESLTIDGKIVVRPEVVTYSREKDPQIHDPSTKARLDELHLRKIDLADYVVVICPGGYIGKSTTAEIDYARDQGKRVVYTNGRGLWSNVPNRWPVRNVKRHRP